MILLNKEEFNKYIQKNYKKLHQTEKWEEFSDEFDGFCDSCHRDVFLKIHSRSYQYSDYNQDRFPIFITYFIECPRCKGKRFMQLVLIEVRVITDNDGKVVENIDYDEEVNYNSKTHYELYQMYSIPTKDESFGNKDIPDEYETLKRSVSEAMFAMTNGKYISSAILFRRALQIIAKDILGAKGSTLYNQLEWLKENKNLLAIDLTNLFHDNSKLIKDVGNQGAHPDNDITLHNFTEDDVNALHDLFLDIVNEIFIKPMQLKAIQADLIKNRKLKV